MFRIVAFIDDRHLAGVMHALTGKVLEQPVIEPVANAVVKNGKLAPEVPSGDDLELLATALRKAKADHVTPKFIQDFMVATGRKATSYSAVLTRAVKAGLLVKNGLKGKSTHYIVVTGDKTKQRKKKGSK